ncbi:hypothetical protein [Agromyces mariniharenae]|uniref:hypothetical protein n=1 Tax=Agromyces mariniharenae TaxID=2604423 RepID=UPI001CA37E7D|nr:hypothetical protein [Agromyces mariniharenae]
MPGSRNTVERAVKVDVDTDRRIAQLAYFMDVPKKAVVREAVAEYAEARLSRAGGGAGADAGGGAGGSGDEGGRGDAVGRGHGGDGEDASRGGELSSTAAALTFEDLPIRDRLALSRGQLIREFAARGGTGVRVVIERPSQRDDEFEFGGAEEDELELLVDTRLEDGSGAVVVLGGIARSILKSWVDVTSLTAVRLYRPSELDDLIARSRPL